MTEVAGGRDARMVPTHSFPLDPPPTLGRKPGSRPLVLLVDDIEDCRDVYGQYLRFTGYEVVEATDGYEALATAVTLAPDAIVMDLWLPHLDGGESIRRLKASPATASIPILVLTGDAYTQARHDAEEAGCQAYLVKPCLPMAVAAEVGRLIVDLRAGAAPPEGSAPPERRGGIPPGPHTPGGAVAPGGHGAGPPHPGGRPPPRR